MKALKIALLVTTLAITSASVFAQPTFNGGRSINREEMKTISVEPAATSDAAYQQALVELNACLLYTSPSPRDVCSSRMPSSA